MGKYNKLVRTGDLVAWGDDSNNQVKDVPPGNDFVEVVPGGSQQSLAIRRDRTFELWGGTNIKTPVPKLNLPGVRFVDAAIGLTHMVAIREDDGTLVPEGKYVFGGLCIPPISSRRFVAVAAGGGHDIALDDEGKLYPWGEPTLVAATTAPVGTFRKVRARGNYSLALDDEGTLFGWGGVFESPVLDQDLWGKDWKRDPLGHWYIKGPFTDMDAGIIQQNFIHIDPQKPIAMPHVLGLYESGRVEGWGANNWGEADQPSGTFRAVAAGKAYSLGLDTSGFLHQWGRVLGGTTIKFGRGLSTDENDRPRRHWMPKGRFISISAAGEHAVAVRDPGPTFRQGSPEMPAQAYKLSEALAIVREAVTRWRQSALADSEGSTRREQQSEQFERLADEVTRHDRR